MYYHELYNVMYQEMSGTDLCILLTISRMSRLVLVALIVNFISCFHHTPSHLCSHFEFYEKKFSSSIFVTFSCALGL